jgi:hypothetical protein
LLKIISEKVITTSILVLTYVLLYYFLASRIFAVGKDRRWYPVIYTEVGSEPSPEPSDWEPLIDKLFDEAILFVRAVGAEHHFRHRVQAKNPKESRKIFDAWMSMEPKPGGSHTMRTLGRMAFEDTGLTAIDIFMQEHSRVQTDLPNTNSIIAVANSEVSTYDAMCIHTGSAIVDSDPNFDTEGNSLEALRTRMDSIREEILADPDYYRPFS